MRPDTKQWFNGDADINLPINPGNVKEIFSNC